MFFIHFLERTIVKIKITIRVYRDHKILITLRTNSNLPSCSHVKVSSRRKFICVVSIHPDQLTYTNKCNARHALSCILHYLLSRKIDHSVYADLSDGGNDLPLSWNEKNLSFSSNGENAILIPDHHFVHSKGYFQLRKKILSAPNLWSEREEKIVWRGSITGKGFPYTTPFNANNPELMLRVRFCLLTMKHTKVDAAIANNNVLQQEPAAQQKLIELGIAKAPIPQEMFLNKKFAIDIDGHTNAWQNFFSRLLMGCCVIKIESADGYKQWYYHKLLPWQHFVPVKPDLSDLIEKINWCFSHNEECAAIAKTGQQLAFEIAAEEFPLTK